MDTSASTQQLFDLWRRQIEDSTQAWARLIGAPPGPSGPDAAVFWRPLMDQGIAAWSRIMSQAPVSPELMGQWKQFLDAWIEAWSKALGQAMGTEAFAQALGQYLDQWLAGYGPTKKATEQTMETTLHSLGLPTRGQVTGVAQQIVELEERLERLEDALGALLKRLETGNAGDRKNHRRASRR
jgi:hypothetical protein